MSLSFLEVRQTVSVRPSLCSLTFPAIIVKGMTSGIYHGIERWRTTQDTTSWPIDDPVESNINNNWIYSLYFSHGVYELGTTTLCGGRAIITKGKNNIKKNNTKYVFSFSRDKTPSWLRNSIIMATIIHITRWYWINDPIRSDSCEHSVYGFLC